MNKKLLKLKHQLDLAIERNNAVRILKIRKKILNLESEENDLEEINNKI